MDSCGSRVEIAAAVYSGTCDDRHLADVDETRSSIADRPLQPGDVLFQHPGGTSSDGRGQMTAARETAIDAQLRNRQAESRAGKECVSQCSTRWLPDH